MDLLYFLNDQFYLYFQHQFNKLNCYLLEFILVS